MADSSSTTSFRADISQLKSAMQQAQRSVKLANAEFKAATAGMDGWNKSASGLQAKLKQLNTTLTSQEKVLALQKEELAKTEKEYGENSAAADKCRVAIFNQEAAIKNTQKQLAYYEQELNKAGQSEDSLGKETDEMNQSTKKASDGFTVMKGVLADLVASGIKMAIDGFKDMAKYAIEAYQEFDKGQDIIVAKTGATGEQLDGLRESYKTLATQIVADSETIGSAVGEVNTKFGASGEELDNLSKKFLEFSQLNNTDVSTSIDNVQRAMTAWGVPMEEADKMLDLLNATGQKTGASVDSITTSLTTNAAVLKDMGFNIDQAASFLGKLELAGVDSTTVMAGLKKALTNSAKEGLSTKDALAELQKKMESSGSTAEATTEAIDLFGTKAAPAIAEACESGRLNFEELGKAMGNYEGNLDQTYENTLDATDKIKLTFQGMKTEVGAYMAEMLTEAEPEIDELLSFIEESFGEVMETLKDNAPEIKDTIIDIVKGLTDFIKTIIENFDGIISVIKSVGTVLLATFAVSKLMTFASAIGTMITTFKTLKTATDAATASQTLLNAAQAATPIGLIAAGVAGLAAGLLYLVSSNDKATESMETLNEWEQEQVDQVYELKKAYDELKESRDKQNEGINAEFAHYEELANELDTLVDANGKVKEGYEDRANFIITTLNDAVGTEMELVDGVVQGYDTETESIYKLIEAKKAQAILDTNEELYAEAIKNSDEALQNYITTQGIYAQNKSDLAAVEQRLTELTSMSADEYARRNGLTGSARANEEALAKAIAGTEDELHAAQGAYVESKRAMELAEDTYVGYQSTIQNYEGLSSAIISGDADKISQALKNMQNDFITAETGTRDSLERQVKNYEKHYQELKQALDSGSAVVTEEMVSSAKGMVDQAQAELDKFPTNVEKSANTSLSSYAKSIESNKGKVTSGWAALRDDGAKELDKSDEYNKAGENNVQGYINGMSSLQGQAELTSGNVGTSSVNALNTSIEAHSPSKKTYQSGEYFGQGFINGMDSKSSAIYKKAYELARKAVEALKAGQQEGSPSKLTYQSGVYFTEGYMNGIASMTKELTKTVQTMTASAIKTAMDLNGFDFVDEMTTNVADKLEKSFGDKTGYLLKKITFQNQKKLEEFDNEVKRLEAERDGKLNSLQTQLDNASDDATKEAIKNQKKALESEYAALIATQNKYKAAYQNASNEMLTGLTTAINSYSDKAKELINSTIGGIADKYQQQYNALIDKQNTLIEKLKGAGSLFEISGAGVMTINDLKEQTKQIKDYTSKLTQIKSKVTSGLFDEITALDMKEGAAFIDQLLSMDAKDLKAYSQAYEEKMKIAQQASESVYKSEMDGVAKDYKAELQKAMSQLPSQLEALGVDTMKGFVDGLTKDTDYMESEVKTFISGMVDTFKKELQIHSPSKVMMKLGGFTGEGLVNGLRDTIDDVKRMASSMAYAVSNPLSDMRASVNMARASVGATASAVGAGSVVNNYNMVQNNTSPKALTALETYQARREQISLVKAFMKD